MDGIGAFCTVGRLLENPYELLCEMIQGSRLRIRVAGKLASYWISPSPSDRSTTVRLCGRSSTGGEGRGEYEGKGGEESPHIELPPL